MAETGYELVRLLFQRGLGLVYLLAFLVAARQFRPLIGEDGLLPVPEFVDRVDFRQKPSIFQLFPTDRAMQLAAWTGVGLSLLAVTGLSEQFGTGASMLVWLLLWLLYLSFVNVGQTFWGFGWESLLLETGFLAVFLGGAGTTAPEIIIWLLRWVLFRVMFGAGLIKLRGDDCWRDLTCMDHHHETQPMPNPLSRYFHMLPGPVHKIEVAVNHVVELIVPFLYFAPQPFASIAGGITILFQAWLMLSGNYAWLNYLTIVLSLSTFTDATLGFLPLETAAAAPASGPHQLAVFGVAGLVLALSYFPVRNMLSPRQVMNTSYTPLHLVNTYGAFGSVTETRYEVVIEGTQEADPDEEDWEEYGFYGKPSEPGRIPRQYAPYHLRLDWQLWFAALSPYYQHPWFPDLLRKLLANDEEILRLLRHNPFPDQGPDQVQARLFRYRYTTKEERKETGDWWHREPVREYFPPVSGEDAPLFSSGRPRYRH